MNDDLLKINQHLGKQIEILTEKLNIGIVGLKAIISEGSDNLNIAEKTLKAMEDCGKDSPQESD